MIEYVEFFQDLPIPQHSTATSRRFNSTDGWYFSLASNSITLRHQGRLLDIFIQGVPFIVYRHYGDEIQTSEVHVHPVNTKKGKNR